MNGRSTPVWSLVLGLTFLSVARGAVPMTAQTEINYLLGFVESSGCEFYRNGSWYDSKGAQMHLRHKYEMLAAREQINTAEDFIEKAATKSSLSGQPYQVRCRGHDAVSSNPWLRDVLARYRAKAPRGAPPSMRGALGTDAIDPNRSLTVLGATNRIELCDRLQRIWDETSASHPRALEQLRDLCAQAEVSRVLMLRKFALRLRSYAKAAGSA
jgi:hypothetical protein